MASEGREHRSVRTGEAVVRGQAAASGSECADNGTRRGGSVESFDCCTAVCCEL